MHDWKKHIESAPVSCFAFPYYANIAILKRMLPGRGNLILIHCGIDS